MTGGNLKRFLFSTHSHPTSASSYSELASSTTTSESCSSLGVPQSGSGSGAGTKPSPGHLRRFRPGEESARKRLHDLTSRLSRITWKNNNHAPWANFVTVTFQSYIMRRSKRKPYQASDWPRIGFILSSPLINFVLKNAIYRHVFDGISTFEAWCFCPILSAKCRRTHTKGKIQHRHYSNNSEENES